MRKKDRPEEGPGTGDGPEDGPAPIGKGRRRPLWMAWVAALITFLAVVGLYAKQQRQITDSPAGLFIESQAAGTTLPSVGRMRGGATDCSAWLVDPGSASSESPTPAPPGSWDALAVTTARCVGLIDTITVISKKPVTGPVIEFNAFAPLTSAAAANVVPAAVTAIEWASARWTDLAVVRLGTTYGQLAALGVRPIRPVSLPATGDRILVAGVPTEGIPEDQKYLRGHRCHVQGEADVLEYRWVWEGMAAASDCEIRGVGSAGSVAFNVAGDAVGMVTTSTIGADEDEPCYLDEPCEIREAGKAELVRNRTYLLSVAGLASCFRSGELTLGDSCPLENPEGVIPAVSEQRAGKPGSLLPVQISGTVAPGTKVATLQGPLGDTRCRPASAEPKPASSEPADTGSAQSAASVEPSASDSKPSDSGGPKWSSAVPAQDWSLSIRLPADEGWVMACVGSAQHPTPVVVESDGTPPDAGTIRLDQQEVKGGMQVQPVLDPPNLSSFRWVSGPRGSMDCQAAEGYTDYERVPAIIQADDLPATVCLIGSDDAGNASQPAAIDVG